MVTTDARDRHGPGPSMDWLGVGSEIFVGYFRRIGSAPLSKYATNAIYSSCQWL